MTIAINAIICCTYKGILTKKGAFAMPDNILFDLVHEYGYFTFFIVLCLGIIGLPIPNEVTVMTAGLVASIPLLNPTLTYVFSLAGIISGLTVCYLIGRFAGAPLIEKFQSNTKNKYIRLSSSYIKKYGYKALWISYFFAGVRNFVPLLIGMNKLPYSTFAINAYITGLLWTTIFFTVGYLFGESIDDISKWINEISIFLGIIILLLILWFTYGKKQRQYNRGN